MIFFLRLALSLLKLYKFSCERLVYRDKIIVQESHASQEGGGGVVVVTGILRYVPNLKYIGTVILYFDASRLYFFHIIVPPFIIFDLAI